MMIDLDKFKIIVTEHLDCENNVYYSARYDGISILDGCIGGGDFPEEAKKELRENAEVLLEYLESIGELGEDI